jgi:hypothetical protein
VYHPEPACACLSQAGQAGEAKDLNFRIGLAPLYDAGHSAANCLGFSSGASKTRFAEESQPT